VCDPAFIAHYNARIFTHVGNNAGRVIFSRGYRVTSFTHSRTHNKSSSCPLSLSVSECPGRKETPPAPTPPLQSDLSRFFSHIFIIIYNQLTPPAPITCKTRPQTNQILNIRVVNIINKTNTAFTKTIII